MSAQAGEPSILEEIEKLIDENVDVSASELLNMLPREVLEQAYHILGRFASADFARLRYMKGSNLGSAEFHQAIRTEAENAIAVQHILEVELNSRR